MQKLTAIIHQISKECKLNLTEKDRVRIARRLIKAGFSEILQSKEVATVKKSVLSICKKTYNPLKVEANCQAKAQNQNAARCPLCKSITASQLVNVTLADGRVALYCTEHNVTIPCSV